MKYFFVIVFTVFLSACGSKLDGTYSNNVTGIAEQKVSFTFKPDGTARMSIGSSTLPVEVPYEVSGNKIKVAGQGGELVITILDNGDLLMEGLRLTKEDTSHVATNSPATPVPTNTNEARVSEAKKPQEKDMAFCRELAAKTRAAKPGDFASDPEFLPSMNHCYALAKETGEVLVWFSDNASPAKDSNLK